MPRRFKRPNRALLRVLPFLQKEDGPIRSSRVARRLGEDPLRVRLALIRLNDERIIAHRWADWEGGVGPPRESEWWIRPMEETLTARGEWQ